MNNKLLDASNKISQTTYKGSSNWLITYAKYLSDIKKNWRKDSIKNIFNL